jgi:soluble lytic murein transglycosylase-like protein
LISAGTQVEEPLSDSVRGTLSSAVSNSSPPTFKFHSSEARLEYLRWVTEAQRRLSGFRNNHLAASEFLETLWYESHRAGLAPSLVLAVVEVESGFRKYAISSAGARGYMQVMPFWARLIGDSDVSKLFHSQTNLRFGCVILRHYLDVERGDIFFALGRYNGSRGRAEYPNLIFSAKERWNF